MVEVKVKNDGKRNRRVVLRPDGRKMRTGQLRTPRPGFRRKPGAEKS